MYQSSERNRTNIQFAELRAIVDKKFEVLHDELSDCYYNFWKQGLSKPFKADGKIYDLGATPVQSKALFDKLHAYLFWLYTVEFHNENMKQPIGEKIDTSLYNDITNDLGLVVMTYSTEAQLQMDTAKLQGMEIILA
jgi:hypothetical protein